MTMTTTITVFGVKEALKELRDIDPDLRKQINAKAKDIAKPAVDGIKNAYPQKYLSGMQRNWTQRSRPKFPYDQAAARKGVVLKIDTGKKSQSVIRIDQRDPAAAIIDMAGKKGGRNAQGGRFVDALTAIYGQPSRVMWPTYLANGNEVQQRMFNVVEDLMEMVNKKVLM
jgi:hypothetical protein